MKRVLLCATVLGCGNSSSAGNGDDAGVTVDAQPSLAATPIKHVVVIVKENHTFDNYFGAFPNADGSTQIQTPGG